MKRIITKYFILSVLAVFSLTSCSDYLDKQPDDQLTLEMVFNNKTNTQRWLANIYSYIPDTYSYGTVEPCGDDMVPSPRWEQFNFKVIQYQKGNWNPLSEGGISYWTTLPKAIRSAYIFLDNVKVLPGQDQAAVDNMKAECQFLIGYYHSLLVMTYGGVPIIKGAYETNLSADELMVKQNRFDDVVNWTDSLLLATASKLPAKYPSINTDYGRATSIMCYAVRARLLTFAASDLVNGNADLADFKNCDGTPVFNATKDMNKWQKAADACKLLIDEADKAGHKIYKEYLSDGTTIDPFMSYQNVTLKRFDEGNTEILMDRPYSGGYGGYDNNCFPRGVGGIGAIAVSQTLVDAFFMKDGTRPIIGYTVDAGTPIINPATTLYAEKGFSTTDETRKTKWREGSSAANSSLNENIVVPKGTFKMYCNREPRFYVSVLTNDAWCRYGARNTDFYMNGKDGGPTHDAPQNGYLLRKKVDPNADPKLNTHKSRTAILFRLAEFYLSYAEALNELDYNQNKTEILKYVNYIRERAGIAQYDVALPAPADQTTMRELIRQERHVELNNECFIRWDDIRRWKQGNLIDGKCWGMNFNGKQKSDDPSIVDAAGVKLAFYVRDSYFTRKFKSYWWPIPQSDIEKNPNLRQMPGW